MEQEYNIEIKLFEEYKLEECGKWKIDRGFAKQFLSASNHRIAQQAQKKVIDEVREWAEKGNRRVRDWKPSTYGEMEIQRLAEESILGDLHTFLNSLQDNNK